MPNNDANKTTAGPEAPTATLERDRSERPGDVIGPYRLLSLLGEGGFGTVWLAERRQPFTQRVALKVIKPGMDSRAVIARFEQERQALAVMDHPSVAKVHDAGLTGPGRPYFVMEHVPGEPITEYCDRHNLSIRQRLELFLPVCEAVQHAHHKGIIHRDLKPSNILVAVYDDRPIPKVIDFGVAKAVSRTLTDRTIFTETGHMIGTPEYMSPEQAEMGRTDIDTRTDVYSLGAVLYELLSGRVPFDSKALRVAGYNEIQRIIREVDPPKPSTRLSSLAAEDSADIAGHRHAERESLAKELRRELDWIPMKALRKDRTQRYGSPAELAQDVRRYLQGNPLLAGPESARYRLRKFARRNRGPVTAGALVLLSLIAGLSATLVALNRARRAEAHAVGLARSEKDLRESAEQARTKAALEAENAKQVVALMSDLFRVPDPENAHGDAMTASEALQRAAATLEDRLATQPVVRAALLETIGQTYLNLGLPERADAMFTAALDTRRTSLGPEDPETLVALGGLALVRVAQGRLDDAESLRRDAVRRLTAAAGPEDRRTLVSEGNLGALLRERGKLGEAEQTLRQAVRGLSSACGPTQPETLIAKSDLALCLMDRSKLQEAEQLDREASEGLEARFGPRDPRVLALSHNLAGLYMAQGRFTDAEPVAMAAVEGERRVLGPEHPETMSSVAVLADLRRIQGRFDQCESLVRENLAVQRRVMRRDHPNTLGSMNLLVLALQGQNKLDQAETLARELMAGCERALGEEHPVRVAALGNLALTLAMQKKFDQAEPYARQRLKTCIQLYGDGHPETVLAMNNLAGYLRDQAKYAQALELYEQLMPLARPAFPGQSLYPLYMQRGYGDCLAKMERFGEAETQLLSVREQLAAQTGPASPDTVRTTERLATLYDAWEKAEPGKGHDAQAGKWRVQIKARQP